MALSLRGPVIRGGAASGSQNAANLVNITRSFGESRASSPQFGKISEGNILARGDEMAHKFMLEGAAHETGLNAMGSLKELQQQLDAQDELNSRMQQEKKTAGIFEGIAGIAAPLLMGGPMAPVAAGMGALKLGASFLG